MMAFASAFSSSFAVAYFEQAAQGIEGAVVENLAQR